MTIGARVIPNQKVRSPCFAIYSTLRRHTYETQKQLFYFSISTFKEMSSWAVLKYLVDGNLLNDRDAHNVEKAIALICVSYQLQYL